MLPGNRANAEPSDPDVTSSGAEVRGSGPQGSQRGALGVSPALSKGGRGQALRLWSPVLVRVLFGALLLGLVVYLGHRSQDVALYGESVTLLVENRPRGAAGLVSNHVAPAPAGKAEPPPCKPQSAEKPPSVGMTSDGKVILNEANAAEFSTLPGVGATRAEAILALRKRLGKFKKTADLLRVRGIGFRTFAKWKDRIVVDRPQAEAPQGVSLQADEASGDTSTPPTAGEDPQPFPEPPIIEPPPKHPGQLDPGSPSYPLPDAGAEERPEVPSRVVAKLQR